MAFAVHEKIDEIINDNVTSGRKIAADGIREQDKDVYGNQDVDVDRNEGKTRGEVIDNGDNYSIKENYQSEYVNKDCPCVSDSGNEESCRDEFVDQQGNPSDNCLKYKDQRELVDQQGNPSDNCLKNKDQHELVDQQGNPSDNCLKNKDQRELGNKDGELYNSEIGDIGDIELIHETLTGDNSVKEKRKCEHENKDGESENLEIEDSSYIGLVGEGSAPCDSSVEGNSYECDTSVVVSDESKVNKDGENGAFCNSEVRSESEAVVIGESKNSECVDLQENVNKSDENEKIYSDVTVTGNNNKDMSDINVDEINSDTLDMDESTKSSIVPLDLKAKLQKCQVTLERVDVRKYIKHEEESDKGDTKEINKKGSKVDRNKIDTKQIKEMHDGSNEDPSSESTKIDNTSLDNNQKFTSENIITEKDNIMDSNMTVDIITEKDNIMDSNMTVDIITEKDNIMDSNMTVDIITEKDNIMDSNMTVDIITEKDNIMDSNMTVDIITEKDNIMDSNMTVDIITEKADITGVDSNMAISVDVITEKGNTDNGKKSMSVDIITEKGITDNGEKSVSVDIITVKGDMSVDVITEKGNTDNHEKSMSVDIISEKGNTDTAEKSVSVDIISEKGNTDTAEKSVSVDIISEKGNTDTAEKSVSVDIISEKGNTDTAEKSVSVDIISEKGNTNNGDVDTSVTVDVTTGKGNKNVNIDITESLKEKASEIVNNVNKDMAVSEYDTSHSRKTISLENHFIEPDVKETENIRNTCHKNDGKCSESEFSNKLKESAPDWSKCYVKLNKLDVDNLDISDGIGGNCEPAKTVSAGDINMACQNGHSKFRPTRVTTEVIVDGVIIEETYNVEETSEKQKRKGKRDGDNSDCKKQKVDIDSSNEPGSGHIRSRSTRIRHNTDIKKNSDGEKQKLDSSNEAKSSNQSGSPKTKNKTRETTQTTNCENLKVDDLSTDEQSSGFMQTESWKTRNKMKKVEKNADSEFSNTVKNVPPKITNQKTMKGNFQTSENVCVDINSYSEDEDIKTRGRARSLNTRSRSSTQTDCSHSNISYHDEESLEKGNKENTHSKKSSVKSNEKEMEENMDIDEENIKRKTRQSNVDNSNQTLHEQGKRKEIEKQQQIHGIQKDNVKRKTRQHDNDVDHKLEYTVEETEETEPQWLADAVSKSKNLKRAATPDDIFDEIYQCPQSTDTQCIKDTSGKEMSKRTRRQKTVIDDNDKCVQGSSRQNKSKCLNIIETSVKIKPCSVKIIRYDVTDIHNKGDKIPSKKRNTYQNHDLSNNNQVNIKDTSVPKVRYSPINVDFDAEELDVIETVFSDGMDLIETCLDILDNDLDTCQPSGVADKCPDTCELKHFSDKYCGTKLSNCTVQLIRIDQSKSCPGKARKCQSNKKTSETGTTNTNVLYDVSETRSEKYTINSKQLKQLDITSDKNNEEETMSDSNSNEEFIQQYCMTRRTRQKEKLHKEVETKPRFRNREQHIDSNEANRIEKTESDLETDIIQPRTTRGKKQQKNTNTNVNRKQETKYDHSDKTTSELDLEKSGKRHSPITREKRQRINSDSCNKTEDKAVSDEDTEKDNTKTKGSNSSEIGSNKRAKVDIQSDKVCRKLSLRIEPCKSQSGKSCDSVAGDVFSEEIPESKALCENDFVGRRCRNRSNNTSNNKTKVCNTHLNETECVGRSKRSRHNSGMKSVECELNQTSDEGFVKRPRRCRNNSEKISEVSDVITVETSELGESCDDACTGRTKRCRNNSKISDKKSEDTYESQGNQKIAIVKGECGLNENINCVVKLERLNVSNDLTLLQNQDVQRIEVISENSDVSAKLWSQNCDNETDPSNTLETCVTGDDNKADSELLSGQDSDSTVPNHDSELFSEQDSDSSVPKQNVFCKTGEITENIFSETEEKSENTYTSQDENVLSVTGEYNHTEETSPTKNKNCDIEIVTDLSSDVDMTPMEGKCKECDSNIEILTDPSSDESF